MQLRRKGEAEEEATVILRLASYQLLDSRLARFDGDLIYNYYYMCDDDFLATRPALRINLYNVSRTHVPMLSMLATLISLYRSPHNSIEFYFRMMILRRQSMLYIYISSDAARE